MNVSLTVVLLKKDLNITEEDIAKRLVDYGYHAPMSELASIWHING